jgi:hypothetical protein
LLDPAVRGGDAEASIHFHADAFEFAHAALRILAAAGAMEVGLENGGRPTEPGGSHVVVPTSQNLARLGFIPGTRRRRG